MDNSFKDAVLHITDYFEEHLPQYTIFEVRRQTFNPADDYLYMAAAKKQDGTYAVWTSWNESIHSLNHGHYNLPDMKTCADIMTEYQNTHNTDADEAVTPLDCLQELLIKHDDLLENSYQEILYVMGYADGINAQYENHWNKLTEREIDYLLRETIET